MNELKSWFHAFYWINLFIYSNDRWHSDVEDTFIIFKNKNNKTFVIYFVEFLHYSKCLKISMAALDETQSHMTMTLSGNVCAQVNSDGFSSAV